MFASSYLIFPPEILDEIINQIDDKSMLLSVGLICGQALVKTRRRLFSSLEFTDHERFDCFLHLAGMPWTSFTLAVKEIHLQDVFRHNFHYRYKWKPIQVASNLRNVRSLSISAHNLWRPGWKVVPSSVLDVIFQLNLHDLQIDAVGKWLAEDIVMLFSRLPSSVKTLAFRKLRFRETPDLSLHLNAFRRPFRFRIIDNISLALLRDVLDPSSNLDLDVFVEAFHIRPPYSPLERADNLLTSRFLHHIGHHLEQLLIIFKRPVYSDDTLAYLESTQISRCINIRMLFVSLPDFAYKTPPLLSAMWKMLSALPAPNDLHEFWFKFTPYHVYFEDQMSGFGFFEFPNLLHRLRHMFPNLKIIKIILDTWESECDLYFESLRRVTDLRAFEEIGFVKLVAALGTKDSAHVACHSVLEGLYAAPETFIQLFYICQDIRQVHHLNPIIRRHRHHQSP